ncbi:MAG: hypothetical protein WBO65_07350, partial [Ruminococcus bromii]
IIFDVMKIVHSILHAMRAIVCNAHEGENTVRRYILISTQKQAVRNLYSLLLYGFLVPQPHVPT